MNSKHIALHLNSVGYDSALRTLRAFQPAMEIPLNRHPRMTTISSVALTHQMKNTLTPESNILLTVDRNVTHVISRVYKFFNL